MNTDVPWPSAELAAARVLEIQTKLHRWAKSDPDRCFVGLFNLVVDPAFLQLAWMRVSGNRGARPAGIDRVRAGSIQWAGGEEAFLAALRHDRKSGRFVPLAVRERMIPNASGKLRRRGIPSLRDRVASSPEAGTRADLRGGLQAVELRLPSSQTRARCARRDPLPRQPLLRVGVRGGHRGVLRHDRPHRPARAARATGRRSAPASARQGVPEGQPAHRRRSAPGTLTGTPQGGILSPLLANIALSVLDEHFAERWRASGTSMTRTRLRRQGGATYRLVRYADDFVVLVAGSADHAQALRTEVEAILAPIGLRLSDEKTSVLHIDEGFDFLGFRVQRRRRRGTASRGLYIYPSKKALASIIGKIRDLTRRSEHTDLEALLRRVNAVLRGWSAYFALGASAQTLSYLHQYTWRRVVVWLRKRYIGANWATLRRRYLPRWWPTADGVRLFSPHLEQRVIRTRWRGEKIPTPWSETG